MLDINYIKNNAEKVKKAISDKQLSGTVDIDKLLSDHEDYLNSLKKVEELRAKRNKISEEVSKAEKEDRAAIIEQASAVKADLQGLEVELAGKLAFVQTALLDVPNVIDPEVPYGKDDKDNISIRKIGEPKKMNFAPKDHVELGEALDILDLEKAGEVSGSRFYYLKNEAVMLEFAIVNFVLKTLQDPKIIGDLAKKVGNPSDKLFSPILPPLFIKAPVMDRMARLKPIDERYYFEKDDLVLIGSAEHTLGPMHMDETLKLADLPVRYIGFSPAFRREAGSYGLDTKGIIRVHHFDKLEMESFTTIENGRLEQDLIVAIQEYLIQQLGIPYQVVAISTGDMGKPDYRQLDMECWIPSQNKYRETHTSDYMTDYQARRLNTTYVDASGEKKFVHMNDATAFAVGRIIVAILENYQNEDGSVSVPEVLKPYLSFEKILPKLN